MANPTLLFQPYGKRVKVHAGKTVLEAAREAGVNISSICGGRGVCGKCKVIVRDGKGVLSSPSEGERRIFPEEDLQSGWRLACQARVAGKGTTVVEVPHESQVDRQRLLLRGLEKTVELAPAVEKITISLEPPTLTDPAADVDRFLGGLDERIGLKPTVDYEALRKLPHVLRQGDWTVTATLWKHQEVISVEPGASQNLYGLAVDVGTTKLAAYLVDLQRGVVVSTASMMNPQIAFGEDVISRIHYIMKNEENLEGLHDAVVEGINRLIEEACGNSGVRPEEICDMTLAGNTAMHHIFLGIPPDYVALMPYPAALQSPVDVKARDLHVNVNRGAYGHALPAIAGFVGGDAVADVLATEVHKADELSMVIDIGTNTEIVLGNKERLIACSCASGPAFEGAHIRHGMRAATGAIEHVWIDPATLDVGYKAIDDGKPRGICGSGIVDATAEMLKAGMIGSNGRFNRQTKTERLRMNEKSVEFVIAWKDETMTGSDMVLTQEDIREIQLAKAAIYTGAYVLMKKVQIGAQDIQKIFLAGAFGNYVDPQSAKIIGMYPDIPLERVQFVGNTAGSGARMALLSVDARKTAEKIAKSVEYLELGADPNFQNEFLKATFMPHQETDRFPSVMQLLKKGVQAG